MPSPDGREKRGAEPTKRDRDLVKVPIDPINEEVILAAACVSEDFRSRLTSTVSADNFLDGNNPKLWTGVIELHRRGLDYSLEAMTTIVGYEDALKLDAMVKGRPAPPSRQNLSHHEAYLQWDRARNDVATVLLPEFFEALRDPRTPIERTQGIVMKMAERLKGGDLRHLRTVDAVAAELELELNERMKGRALYPFGIRDLDWFGADDYIERNGDQISIDGYPRMIPGTAPGMTTVVTGESGSGKTVITANMVLGIIEPPRKKGSDELAYEPRRVLWGAWEQEARYSFELIAEISLGLSRTDMFAGHFEAEHARELLDRKNAFKPYLKFFDTPFGRSGETSKYRGEMNEKNLDVLHRYVANSACDVAVFDVFRDSLEDTAPEFEVRALKRIVGIAKETKTHIILVQHLNLKQNEKTVGDGRPTRGKIMGSGDWINKADNVIGVHADRPSRRIEAHILKQRHGRWPLAVAFDCDFEFSHLSNGRSIAVRERGEKDELSEYLEEGPKPRARFAGGSTRRSRKS